MYDPGSSGMEWVRHPFFQSYLRCARSFERQIVHGRSWSFLSITTFFLVALFSVADEEDASLPSISSQGSLGDNSFWKSSSSHSDSELGDKFLVVNWYWFIEWHHKENKFSDGQVSAFIILHGLRKDCFVWISCFVDFLLIWPPLWRALNSRTVKE